MAAERQLRLLVVDDHDVVQWGFRLLLERQGWVERCLAARDGAEAVDLCRRLRPDVALVDMLLGSESGAEVCEEIRAVSPATRVLLISDASTNKEIAARLHLSPHTIKEHTSAIYRKLGVRNRAEATRQAQRLKLLV
jgi:two-component system response regulator DesR